MAADAGRPTLRGTTVALTNSSSGERAAAAFIEQQLREELGPDKVLNLLDFAKHRVDPSDGKTKAKDKFSTAAAWEDAAKDPRLAILLNSLRDAPDGGNVIVAGGDGTIAWGMQLLDDHFDRKPYEQRPYVAIIPMGTGNDLSRSLGFGPGFVRENCCCCCPKASIKGILHSVATAHRSLLDRWLVSVSDAKGNPVAIGHDVMCNYLSIGLDAGMAHKFDTFRRENPGLCKSRSLNKIWYAKFGLGALCGSPYLAGKVRVSVAGAPVPESAYGGLKNLIVTNIDSFGAGMKVWKHSPTKKEWDRQSFHDGKVELCGYHGSWHMLFAQGGLRGSKKVSQGGEILLELPAGAGLKMQIDGEPVLLPDAKCSVKITRHPAGAHKVLTRHHEHCIHTKDYVPPGSPAAAESATSASHAPDLLPDEVAKPGASGVPQGGGNEEPTSPVVQTATL